MHLVPVLLDVLEENHRLRMFSLKVLHTSIGDDLLAMAEEKRVIRLRNLVSLSAALLM